MHSIFSYHSKDESQMALRGAVNMTYFEFDESCWRKIRTSNCIERLNREIKRRTKTIGIFPNIEACERLVVSLLLEKHEEWIGEISYLIKKNRISSTFFEFTEKGLHYQAPRPSL